MGSATAPAFPRLHRCILPGAFGRVPGGRSRCGSGARLAGPDGRSVLLLRACSARPTATSSWSWWMTRGERSEALRHGPAAMCTGGCCTATSLPPHRARWSGGACWMRSECSTLPFVLAKTGTCGFALRAATGCARSGDPSYATEAAGRGSVQTSSRPCYGERYSVTESRTDRCTGRKSAYERSSPCALHRGTCRRGTMLRSGATSMRSSASVPPCSRGILGWQQDACSQ